ncbi:MAG TPA: LamG-like jellyroll fold domain-containing protein, partial [Polyangia bacterium]
TAAGNDLTGVNLKSGARVDGRVGKAVMLDYAQSQWAQLEDTEKKKSFDLTTRATVSIWANARSYRNKGNKEKKTGPGYETMFAKGDNSWRIQKFGTRDWHKPPADLIEMCVEAPPSSDLCVVGKTDMVPGKWFHIVAVHDFPKAKLYVNGVLEKTETFDTNWISDSHAVGLGNQSQFADRGRLWDGMLDEARVLNVAKNDDWVKLDYESQREGAKLLTFGKVETRAPQ